MTLALALALAPALVSQTYTVDDDGPADFVDLPAAVLASSPGDTLLVEPGSYTATTVTHDLTIVASTQGPKPSVFGELVIDGPSALTLSGFAVSNILVRNCTGRVRIDACDLLTSYDPGAYGTFVVRDSAVVVITRTHSEPGYAPYFAGSAALGVYDSKVVVVESELRGPDGQNDLISPDWGYEGIACYGDTELVVVASDVSGGNGGYSPKGYDEPGAPAIRGGYSSSIDLTVRGSWNHRLEGGYHGGGGQELAIVAPGATINWSGVTLDPPTGTWPVTAQTVPAEPYLVLGGNDSPGAERRLQTYGPAGLPMVTFFTTQPGYLSVPGMLGDPLLVSAGHVLTTRTTVLQGQGTPASVALPLPTDPTLAGLTLDVQGVAVTPSGIFLANGHQLVLRF